MSGWTRPDRHHRRGARWVAADVLVTALFTWITVASLRSDAYVDQYGAPAGAQWLLATAPGALLLVRRYAPVAALTGATALYLTASASQGDSNAPLAAPLLAYSVALTRPARVSAVIVGAAATAMSSTTFYGPGAVDALVVVGWPALYGVGWGIGAGVRRTQDRTEQLSRTVVDLEAHQARIAAEAIADERARIARELHDAVGHTVNVMVLQAGAARLSRHPDKALRALAEIEDLGRSALTDLDRLLGLLDGDGTAEGTGDGARSPTPTIGDIAAMVADLRTAGADIVLHDRCSGPVDRHTGAAAYRIVQEGLTNALKHAGVAQVEVTLRCTRTDLHVVVADDGRPPPHPGADAPAARVGRGIVGMTERAKILGGRLSAQPVAGGGFRVEAVLPLGPRPRPPAPSARRHQPAP